MLIVNDFTRHEHSGCELEIKECFCSEPSACLQVELTEVVDFFTKPERFKASGARIPKGILLGGPPGTGKTLLARAVAGEARVSFLSLNASEFVEMFAGLGASRVRDLFGQVRHSHLARNQTYQP